jgi:hypothetical protein
VIGNSRNILGIKKQVTSPLSLSQCIYQIDKYLFCLCIMPNLDLWINENNSNRNEEHMITNTINRVENQLLSIKAEHQTIIQPNFHATYIMNLMKRL